MKNALRWSLIPTVFFLDRLSKIWVLEHLKEGEGFPVWRGVFAITRVNNTGAAFGLWRDSSAWLIGVTAVSIAAIVFFLAAAPARRHKVNFYGWALVAGGAFGNLYDRVHFGYVVDYLDFHIWPVFNAADSSICVGVFLVFLSVIRKHAPDPS